MFLKFLAQLVVVEGLGLVFRVDDFFKRYLGVRVNPASDVDGGFPVRARLLPNALNRLVSCAIRPSKAANLRWISPKPVIWAVTFTSAIYRPRRDLGLLARPDRFCLSFASAALRR